MQHLAGFQKDSVPKDLNCNAKVGILHTNSFSTAAQANNSNKALGGYAINQPPFSHFPGV